MNAKRNSRSTIAIRPVSTMCALIQEPCIGHALPRLAASTPRGRKRYPACPSVHPEPRNRFPAESHQSAWREESRLARSERNLRRDDLSREEMGERLEFEYELWLPCVRKKRLPVRAKGIHVLRADASEEIRAKGFDESVDPDVATRVGSIGDRKFYSHDRPKSVPPSPVAWPSALPRRLQVRSQRLQVLHIPRVFRRPRRHCREGSACRPTLGALPLSNEAAHFHPNHKESS